MLWRWQSARFRIAAPLFQTPGSPLHSYLRFTDTRANKVFVTLECLYGFVAAKTDALKRVVKP